MTEIIRNVANFQQIRDMQNNIEEICGAFEEFAEDMLREVLELLGA